MNVAKWINQQQMLGMQQKRRLVQLSTVQQKLSKINSGNESDIANENAIAMHCGTLHLSKHKISQLQDRIFGQDK